MRLVPGWLSIGTIVFLSCAGSAQQTVYDPPPPLPSIVDALEKTQVEASPRPSYRVLQQYQIAGVNNRNADTDVIAEVEFIPPNSKNYRIRKSSGSSRGQQVVRRVLDNEVESASDRGRTALNRDNYDFSYIGQVTLDGQPCYVLGLKPKRQDTRLISGKAWVDSHGFNVRQIEGEVARTPSWWLKKVHIKITFSDRGGIWLPITTEAEADVRVFGPHVLTSRILDFRRASEVALSGPRTNDSNRKQ